MGHYLSEVWDDYHSSSHVYDDSAENCRKAKKLIEETIPDERVDCYEYICMITKTLNCSPGVVKYFLNELKLKHRCYIQVIPKQEWLSRKKP